MREKPAVWSQYGKPRAALEPPLAGGPSRLQSVGEQAASGTAFSVTTSPLSAWHRAPSARRWRPHCTGSHDYLPKECPTHAARSYDRALSQSAVSNQCSASQFLAFVRRCQWNVTLEKEFSTDESSDLVKQRYLKMRSKN